MASDPSIGQTPWGATLNTRLNDIDTKAPLNSPALTGAPTAPDPTTPLGIANKDYVDQSPTKVGRVGRLIAHGHSYISEVGSPRGSTSVQNLDVGEGQRFTEILRDCLIGTGRRYREVTIPPVAAGVTQTFSLGAYPEDGVIEGIWYIPTGALTGANTNTRRHEITTITSLFGLATAAYTQYDSGVNLVAGQPSALLCPFNNLGSVYRTSAGPLGKPLWAPAFWYTSQNFLQFVSTAVGTGLADPGGTVLIKFGGMYRNQGVPGSLFMLGGVYTGGWATTFSAHKSPIAYGPILFVNGAGAASAATSIPIDIAPCNIANGKKIAFGNGVTAVLNAAVTFLDTSVTVTTGSMTGAVAAGEIGVVSGNGTSFASLQPTGTHIAATGINDIAWWPGTFGALDRTTWRSMVHSVIAADCCPYLLPAEKANHVYVAGNGSAASWASFTQPANGRWVLANDFHGPAAAKVFTGAVGGTPPKVTIKTPKPFAGGAIDLFFLALAGTGRGAQASIKVDGANPPTGACTIDTSSVMPNDNVVSIAAVTIANSSATITAATAVFPTATIGMAIEGTNIPTSTFIETVAADGLSATMMHLDSTPSLATASGSRTITLRDWCPMTKRLTGLAAGAHTIVVTLTGMDEATGLAQFVFLAEGLEVDHTPYGWGNIPQLPGTPNSVITNANTDSAAVIAGTSTPFGANSAEPALASGVSLLDFNAALAANAALFLGDGIHPNGAGYTLMADLVLQWLQSNFTSAELLAR
jgi:hypothetical protein